MTKKLATTKGSYLLAASFTIFDLLLVYVLAQRPPLVWRLGLTGFILAIVPFVCRTSTVGESWLNYCVGSALGAYFFIWLHFAFVENPIESFRHRNDLDETPPKKRSFVKRISWAYSFKTTTRSIGFSNQVANVPPASTTSRGRFCIDGILLSFKYFLYIDLAQSYFYIHPLPQPRADGAYALSITSQGIWWQAASVWCFWLSAYGLLSLQYTLLSIVTVGLGMSNSTDWPPIFGKFSDAYTIRRTWGRTWHQNLRRWVTAIGRFITFSLRFKPGSWQSSYIQLYTAFILSGLMHSFGDIMSGAPGGFGRSLPYFFVQAIAITMEDNLIALGKSLGFRETRTTRCIGYIWTAGWFILCGPLLIDLMVETGASFEEQLPFSLIRSTWSYFNPGATFSYPWDVSQTTVV